MNTTDLLCKSLIVCEKTSVDPQSKLLSITNILDRLFVTVGADEVKQVGVDYKQVRLPVELVVIWERGGAVGEIVRKFKIHFFDPNGKKIFDHVVSDVKLRDTTQKFYAIIKLGGLPCASSGMHTFKVFFDDETSTEPLLEERIQIVMVDEKGARLEIPE